MQIKLLKDIVLNVAGQPAVKIVDLLHNKKNVNEFLIAKKLGLTINQTRNILYKLADYGLVGFVRKKDSKKGGWYIYFWTLNIGKSIDLFKGQLQNQINLLKEQLEKRKHDRFYYSPSANIEYNEEQALEHNFICPETGEVMQLKDNAVEIAALEKQIEGLTNSLNEVGQESQEIHKKEQQVKNRKVRVEQRKKDLERKNRAIARKREKTRLKNKTGGRPKKEVVSKKKKKKK